jgi:FXSXX-COOH protein
VDTVRTEIPDTREVPLSRIGDRSGPADLALIRRVAPSARSGEVAVAAFNSSI